MKTEEAKYGTNWREQSLENLEKDYWGEPEYNSYLVKTCHKLRKKPLKDFEIEDLRIMIGQNIGLKFLIPIALEKLKLNIFASGDFYEGDLLKSVLKSEMGFWKDRADCFDELEKVVRENQGKLDQNSPNLTKEFNRLKSSLQNDLE